MGIIREGNGKLEAQFLRLLDVLENIIILHNMKNDITKAVTVAGRTSLEFEKECL